MSLSKLIICILLFNFSNIIAQGLLIDRKQNALGLEIGKSWTNNISPFSVGTGFSLSGLIDVGFVVGSGKFKDNTIDQYDLSFNSFAFNLQICVVKPTIDTQPFGLAFALIYDDINYTKTSLNNSLDSKEYKANIAAPVLILYSLNQISNNRILASLVIGYSVTSGGIEGKKLGSNYVSVGLNADIAHEFSERFLGTWGLGFAFANSSFSAGVSIGFIYKVKI